MNLSSRRRHISPKERLRRMAEGRCYYYGGLSHMTSDCPNSPNRRRPLQAAEIVLVPSIASPTASDSNFDASEQSRKA